MAENGFKNNIHVYKKRHNINIGMILFGVILLYLLVTMFSYVTAKHVSVYEVREGAILKDNSYTGIILREEMVVNATESGYINYFASEGSKVGNLTNVYSISNEKLVFDNAETENIENEIVMSSEEQNALILKAHTFTDSYQDAKYEDVYHLKENVEAIITSNSTQSRQAQLQAMLDNGSSGLKVFSSGKDGIIIYSIDGYESYKLEDLTKHMITRADYSKNELTNNSEVSSGDPIYKLVTSEDWKLIIELDDKMAEELAEKSTIRVRFKKDNQTTRAGFKIEKTKERSIGILSFDHSMVRYAAERFLDIEIILEDESGLKIPRTSVVEKEFYLVPEDYITSGGNTNTDGVLIKSKKDAIEFKEVNVYYRDHEKGMVYLEPENFDKNTVLMKTDSNETYTLSEKATLSGVYNINKGYAVFRQVHILCESDEYYIVESGSTYGLTNYDHIALDGNTVDENDVVF